MDSQRTRRAQEIASRAGQIPAAERDAFLESSCPDDAELRAAVDALLDDRPPDLAEGATHGDLQLVRELGQGAQGVVFEARQLSLDRPVSVKFLRPDLVQGEEARERFAHECRAAGRLDHPHIAAVHGTGWWGEHFYLVQEYIGGGDLDAAIKQSTEGRLEPREAASTCRDLASALHHAHEHQVIHRDVKPSNVLLTAEGVPKLADFGLAQLQDDLGLSAAGAVMGTPLYMSPEQVSPNIGAVDARTDVYSLGAVLYTLLTGRPPYVAESLSSLFSQILIRPPRRPSRVGRAIDPALEAICLKALNKDRSDRFESAEALADDLSRWLAGEPTRARPLGLAGRVAYRLRSLRASAWLMVAALATVMVAGLELWVTGPGARVTAAAGDDGDALALRIVSLVVLGLGAAGALTAGQRLLPRWRRVAVVTLGLAILAGSAWRVTSALAESTFGLRQHARLSLEREIDLSGRRDVHDLETFIATWEPEFEDADRYLVAKGYLVRGRFRQAAAWAERLQADAPDAPKVAAVLSLAYRGLGERELATTWEEALWGHLDGPWSAAEWRRVGQLMTLQRRHVQADRAYAHAGERLAAAVETLPPDQVSDSLYLHLLISLERAQALQELCMDEQAQETLAMVRSLPGDSFDPRTLDAQFRLALAADDAEAARVVLERVESDPSTLVSEALEKRYWYVQIAEGEAAARQFLEATAGGAAGDPEAVGWCAARAFALAEAEQDNGQQVELYTYAQLLYTTLEGLSSDSPVPSVGLAATAFELSNLETRLKKERLQSALSHAEAALERDPDYYEAHFNRAWVRYKLDQLEKGGPDLETWEAFAQDLGAAVACNGLNPDVVNDLAYARGAVAEAKGERVDAKTFGLIGWAIELSSMPPSSRCASKPQQRKQLSACWDTRRGLHLVNEEQDEAVESARSALDALQPGDPDYSKREQALAELLAGN